VRPTKYEPPKPFISHIRHKKARIRKKKIKYILQYWYKYRFIEIYHADKWGLPIGLTESDKYMTIKPHVFIQEFINDIQE